MVIILIQSTIENLAAQTANIFLQNGYNHRSIREKEFALQKIVQLHHENGYDCYSPEIVSLFIRDAENRYQQKEIGKIRFMFLTKTADYLTEYHEKGSITLYARRVPSALSPYYEDLLTDIKAYGEWNDKTKCSIRQVANPYFKWLLANGIGSFAQVDDSIIRKYLMDCSRRMTLNSIDTIKRSLKKLHLYLYEIGITGNSFADTLSFVTPTEHKVKKPVPLDEIAAVLDIIDRSTAMGKRDYAMIMTAAVTGIRSVDIINLTFDAIDWINGEIRITQHKTGKTLALPLTTDVGEAIQDYILNGRPKSDLPFVFLRAKSPAVQLGRTLPYQTFNVYRKKLGLPKCTFHGLRRAVGTNMVISGVPVTTVSQVLGHSSIEPTKQYISLDSTHLKECALNLEGFMPEKGGGHV